MLQIVIIKFVEFIKNHIVTMSKRLKIDVRIITFLQMLLNDLFSFSKIIK